MFGKCDRKDEGKVILKAGSVLCDSSQWSSSASSKKSLREQYRRLEPSLMKRKDGTCLLLKETKPLARTSATALVVGYVSGNVNWEELDELPSRFLRRKAKAKRYADEDRKALKRFEEEEGFDLHGKSEEGEGEEYTIKALKNKMLDIELKWKEVEEEIMGSEEYKDGELRYIFLADGDQVNHELLLFCKQVEKLKEKEQNCMLKSIRIISFHNYLDQKNSIDLLDNAIAKQFVYHFKINSNAKNAVDLEITYHLGMLHHKLKKNIGLIVVTSDEFAAQFINRIKVKRENSDALLASNSIGHFLKDLVGDDQIKRIIYKEELLEEVISKSNGLSPKRIEKENLNNNGISVKEFQRAKAVKEVVQFLKPKISVGSYPISSIQNSLPNELKMWKNLITSSEVLEQINCTLQNQSLVSKREIPNVDVCEHCHTFGWNHGDEGVCIQIIVELYHSLNLTETNKAKLGMTILIPPNVKMKGGWSKILKIMDALGENK